MSVSVLKPEFVVKTDMMYAAFTAQQYGYKRTTSPRPTSNNNRLNVKNSPSPSRDRVRDKSPRITTNNKSSNTARMNSPARTCHACHDNQSSLVHSVAKISICDNKTNNCGVVVEDTSLLQRSSSKCSSTTAVTTTHLADLLDGSDTSPVVLDCRSFIAYNLCHIKGAINVGCADRVTKRRLQSGKICVADLIKCPKAREQFVGNVGADFVIYDDNSTEITEGVCGSNNSLQLVLKSLLSRDLKVHFLRGGLAEFHARYEKLCNQSKPSASTPLYSPTTPIVSNEIDTAVASKVLPFLYIGNERDASNRERLQELGITHILNVTSHIPFHFEDDASICYKRLQASDSGSQNLKQYFMEASRFIDEVYRSGGKVLVHCQAGVSRSATITVAYIILHTNMTMMDAFKYVKSCRSIVAPNFNFMGQLMEFENCLNDGNLVRNLGVDLGIQSRV